jgi:FkbM family methyltransferase
VGRHLFVNHRRTEADIEQAYTVLRSIPGVAERLDETTVVEIGANIGSHTVELLRRYGAGHVVAIEPDRDNCNLLRQNVVANDVADHVTLLTLALSDTDGAVELELSHVNSGDHRVRVTDPPANGAESERATVEVRAARFDSLVDSGEIDLGTTGLVWMDAQGHEGHILRGAQRLLESPVPVVMEYWPYGLRRAGGLEVLHEALAAHYTHVIEIHPPGDAAPRVLKATDVARLEAEYGWSEDSPGTDLILARAISGP